MNTSQNTIRSGGISKLSWGPSISNLVNSDRVQKLNDKLNDLQLNITHGKSRKIEEIESKLTNLDSKVLNWHEDNNKRFNNIKDQLSNIFKYIEEDKA